MKITLTSIHVNDPIEAFSFYTEVLGFIEKLYMPEAKLAIVISPDEPGGTGLLLEPNENPVAASYQQGLYEQGLPAIVFGVDDIQGEYERLKEKGVTFKKEPVRTDWGYEAIFDDSCGNFIQLAQTG